MNSLELFQTAMDRGIPERLPVAPMVNVPHASHVLGVKPWEYVTNNELYVKGQLKAQRKYGYDWIFNHQPIQGITEKERKGLFVDENFVVLTTELGSKLKIPLGGGPAVKEPALEDYSRLDELQVPDLDAKGRMEPLTRLLELTKDKVYVCSKVQAPFHYAAEWMRGMDNFMIDMLTKPKEVHRLLDFMTEVAIETGKKQIEVGTHGIMMEDPSAASQVISPEHYKEFAYPYEKKVCKALMRWGGDVVLHICGDTSPILEDLAKTGAKCLSVDESVSLKTAMEEVGGRVSLFGNVPVGVIYNGTEEEIKRSVLNCIESAGEKGYIVSSSCGLHSGTPFKNLHTMVDTVKSYKVGH
ncbi:MAG: uroporphyrinogen decarboxylase family protein [Candidatus Hydrothermarchaeales archaeon]